eukprot:TRINITY_DN10373_c0_g3_i1.p1 TRINITY_DN10373_c0_g3~~TRINITY_DN10373_c0_g3_i1.p1  ORF type:complete len:3444 (+),score=1305.70 TRINITY_DN10373_c0_g3_i1:145-10476(+)
MEQIESGERSDNGTDSQTASITSSRNTQDNMNKTQAQSSFFVSSVPLIPFVQTLDWQYPQVFSGLGLLAEWVQVWAWALNPHVPYGEVLHALSHIVYASHIPLWDNKSADIGYYPSVGVLFFLIAMMCAGWAWCICYVSAAQKLSKNWLECGCRALMHSLCTWAFIPINSMFLGLLICNGDDKLWAVGDSESCAGVLPVMHRLLSGLMIPLLFGFCYILGSMVYDQNCFSPHLVARAHSRLEKIGLTWKALTCVLFHALHADGHANIFFVYLTITCLIMAGLHALFIPYFHQSVNRWKCALYMGGAWHSIVALSTTYSGMLPATDLDFALMACGIIPVCVLGMMFADIRISPLFEEWKIYYLSGSIKDGHTPAYEPTGIMGDDLYNRYRQKGTEILYPLSQNESSHAGDTDGRPVPGAFMVPYVNHVYFATDVELATRYCMYFTHWTKKAPPARMVDHGNRLFYRAIASFKSSDMLPLHAARFSCWHSSEDEEARKRTLSDVMALYLETVSSRLRSSLEYRYQVAKLKKYVRVQVGVQDTSHLKIWGAAQKLHKEVLNQMSNFWGKLLMSQVDTMQLAVITNQITSNREQADQEFRRVLDICKEETVILSYALFLEQVILDDEGAEMLREQTQQNSQFKRTQVDDGVGSIGSTTTHTPSSQHQSQLSELRYMLFFMSVILVTYLAGLFAYQHWLVGYEVQVVNGMQRAGTVRMLAQQAGYNVAELCALETTCREKLFGTEHVESSLVSQGTDTRKTQRKEQLRRIASDFQAQHKLLTLASDRSSFDRLVDYNTEPTAQLLMNYIEGGEEIGGTDVDLISRAGRYLPVGLWNLGFEYSAVLWRLLTESSESDPPMETYRWVDENLGSTVAEMFNHAVVLHHEEAKELYHTHVVLSSVFFVVGLIILVVVYSLLISNFERIEQAKLEALNLFTLIPKHELAKLHKATKTKLQHFDQKQELGQKNGLEGEVSQIDSDTEGSTTDSDDGDALPALDNKDLEIEQYADDEEGSAKYDALTKMTLVSVLLLALACLGVSVALLQLQDHAVEPYQDEVKAFRIYERFRDYSEEMTENVWLYVMSEDPFYLVKYSELLGESPAAEYKEQLLALKHGLNVNYAFAELIRAHEDLVARQKIILKIAASKSGRELPAVLTNVEWKYLNSYEAKLNFFRFHLNDTTQDLSLPLEKQQLLVSQYLFDPELSVRLHEQLRKVQEATTSSRKDAVDDAAVNVLLILAIAIWSLMIVSGMFILASTKRNPVLFRKTSLIVKTVLLMMIAAAGLRLVVLVHEKIDDIEGIAQEEITALRATNTSLSVTASVIKSVTSFLTTNETSHYERFWDLLRENDRVDTLTSLRATPEEVVAHHEHADELLRLCRIALTLHVWASGLSMTAFAKGDTFPELVGMYWDLKAEAGNEETTAEANADESWYSTADHDAQLPPAEQIRIVRSILKSKKFRDHAGALHTTVRSLMTRWETDNHELEDIEHDVATLVFTTFCLAGALCLLFGAYVISLFIGYLERNRQFTGNSGDNSGSVPTTRSQLCLGLLAVLFTATFYLQVGSLQRFKGDVDTLFYTSQREVGVASAQYLATKVAYSDTDRQFLARKLLEAKLDEIEHSRAALYFGENRKSGDLNRLSDPDVIFSHQTYNFPSCTSMASAAEANVEGNLLLARGVDTAVRYWVENARKLLPLPGETAGDRAALRDQVTNLTDSVDYVVYALEHSTAAYNEEAKSNIWAWQQGFLALLTFTVCLVIIQLLVIFRPMISQLLHQDSGTNIMLKMIPEDARELVPVIQEYLDSGQVRDADPMEIINESINELSSVPIVAIDHVGTVIRFTSGGEAVFGWQQSEVVGSNIRLLMPPEYAKQHSHWLASYLKTGQKKIIGTVRQVVGYRKDGTRFPMQVAVREYRPPGEQPLFISTVEDLTKTFEVDEARQLNMAIQQISNVPLICIDTLASITSFNNAAEQCFGFTKEEAMGQNVSILMPEETAKNHDGYVAAYIKTGIKKVIDGERRAIGLRKNGNTFPLVLSIKEAKLKDFGASSLFLGYVRDRTTDLVVEYQQMVRRTVTELNPLPTVSIMEDGTVVAFPTASEELFGYSASEVEGQNVKMLMPQEISDRHDGFLEAYLQTGRRNVIDSTRAVTGKKKAIGEEPSEEIPLQLEVKEVTMTNGDRSYLAFIKDMTTDLEVKLIREVNTKMVEGAPIPIVKISDYGTVLLYNHAAVQSFKFQKHEVVGQNVTILLPPILAKNHDGYLETYRRERGRRSSSIVGNSFMAVAKRSDGSTFRIRLKVDELVSQLDGTISYMGFLYDIEEDKAMEWRNIANEVILSSIKYSIIAIDVVGKVLCFNRTAMECWGYRAEEVMGKNVKMLMKDVYAVKHDGFLSSYQKTGVKTVINTTRLLEAVSKDGNVFPVKLSVMESVDERTGKASMFVGYAEDQTEADLQYKNKQIADALFTESPDPICKIDSFGTIFQVNQALCHFVGYSHEELLKKNVNIMMPEKIAVRHNEILAAYRRTGTSTVIGMSLRQMLRRKSGEEVYISLLVHEVIQEDAEPIFIGFVRDIQDLVIHERENSLADAMRDLSTMPLLAIDNKGTLLKYSRASEVCFGWKADEVLGCNINILMEDSIAARHDGFLRNYRKLGIKKVIDNVQRTTGKKKNGETMTLELHIREVHSNTNDNKQSLFIGFASDITAELAALSIKVLGESIIGRSVEPIIIMDRIGTVQQFNAAAQTLLGYSLEEVCGKNIKMLMPEEIAVKHDGYLASYRKTGIKTVLDSTRVVDAKSKSGEFIPVLLAPREVGEPGNETFVAFAKPMAEELRRREMLAIAEATLTLSGLPCICIDDKGKVVMFKSGEATLGYTEEEALGKNIKFIVPPEIAVQHDGFLLRYRQTRIKRFLGTTIRNNAIKKGGASFPVDVSLREIVMPGSGKLLYVANLRDASVDFMAQTHIEVAQAIQNMSPDPMITIDLYGKVQQWNKAAHKMFGWSEKEMIGANIKRITPPETAAKHDGYLTKYRKSRVSDLVGFSRQLAGWGLKEDGSEGLVPNLNVFLRLVTVEEDLVLGVIKDETHIKNIESRMRQNDLVVRNSPIAFISIDDVGLILRVNPALTTVLGYTAKELEKKANVKQLMDKETASHHDMYLKRYKQTGVKNVIDTTRILGGVHKDGSNVVLETHINEIKVNDNMSQYMGYIRDATDDIAHINDMIISQSSQNLVTVGIIVTEVTGTVISINRHAEELFEVSRDEFVARNVNMIMPQETAVNHDGYLQRYLSDGIKRVVDTSRIVTGMATKKKTTFPVELRVFECESEKSGHHVFVAFIEDQRRLTQLSISKELGDIIVARTPSPLIGIDGDGKIVTFNKAAEGKFGFIEQQMKGSNIRILMPDEIHEKHDGYIRRFIESGCVTEGRKLFSREGMKIDAETKRGTTFSANLRLFHIKTPDGKHLFYGCLKC